jgi:hypothetical protein
MLLIHQGVHNSQSELAQNIRLNTGEKMPSIAELRHGSSTHEQQGPEAGTQHGSGLAPQPLAQAANTTSSFDVKQDDIAAGSVTVPLPAGSSSDNGGTDTDSSTGSTHSTVQGQETASDSSSSHTDSGSTGDGSGSSILQPHSRAGDGSEDDDLLLDTAASFEEYDEVPV